MSRTDLVEWDTYCVAPRRARIARRFMARIAPNMNLGLERLDETQGWFRTTLGFRVIGPRFAVEEFQRDMENMASQWNARHGHG